MARRKSRIIAFQGIYSWDVGSISESEVLEFSWVSDEVKSNLGIEGLTFAKLLVSGTIEHITEIDSMIKKHLINWDFERLNKVDLAVLRISTYPLMFQKDLHPSIVIDEAIDIVKEFGSEDSFKFVNAVLDNIRKEVQ
ncbi:MAG: transcription antitermination factor NusB [Spirochaetaceae bacterium]|mgnify:FL=1|nr:transcription antitermination factor NusB [Spirochaetaceae bacterium]MBQ4554323.1 transcription antitermination factor NusB [Spirochaetaceae bacterium]MBQ8353258.1 transcription antitermination factor NusB [Spirochaetaceae bacterium]